ncbi:tyrosine-type recombinase/integrase, partial [Planctomycetota bacterium]
SLRECSRRMCAPTRSHRAVIRTPDRRTRLGQRDHALLLLMYNTGARVSETLTICLDDLGLSRPPRVRLHGKGGKIRFCPLWNETANALSQFADAQPPPPSSPLFRNARGAPLTRDGVAYILAKHVRRAGEKRPALRRRRATPHVLRNSRAVALLQAGVDLTVIRDYLGHANVATTSRYVSTNLRMKREALEAFWRRAGIKISGDSNWSSTPDLLRFLSSL